MDRIYNEIIVKTNISFIPQLFFLFCRISSFFYHALIFYHIFLEGLGIESDVLSLEFCVLEFQLKFFNFDHLLPSLYFLELSRVILLFIQNVLIEFNSFRPKNLYETFNFEEFINDIKDSIIKNFY